MKIYTRLLLTSLLIVTPVPTLAQVLRRANPDDVGMSLERLARLNSWLQEYVDEGKVAGSVVLVARHGNVVFQEAYGYSNLESGQRMSENAIFRIASQTKAVVSVGAMILQEEGRLLITDPVGKYLPEFMETSVAAANGDGGYDVVAAERRITIRDLLTHTSGVGYGNGVASDRWNTAEIQGWYFADRHEPIRETVRRMTELPFDAQPGERFVYGYSTDVLGALIEEVSGQSLADFLRERILEPLQMFDTHFYVPPNKTGRLATVYSVTEEGDLERAPDSGGMIGQGAYANGPRTSYSGGAGLLSTASDYARFLQMMLNGGELDGFRILSPKTVELMTVNHLETPLGNGTGFGLGFSVVRDLGARGVPGSVGEYGWGGAYHSTYWVDPQEELVVVYFTQLIPTRGLDDHGKLRALVYQAIVGQEGSD